MYLYDKFFSSGTLPIPYINSADIWLLPFFFSPIPLFLISVSFLLFLCLWHRAVKPADSYYLWQLSIL